MVKTVDLRVGANGRMVLPKELREAMGLSGDAKVIATLEGGEVRLTPVHHDARRARDLYRQCVPQPRTVEAFLEDRRQEADQERLMAGRGRNGEPEAEA